MTLRIMGLGVVEWRQSRSPHCNILNEAVIPNVAEWREESPAIGSIIWNVGGIPDGDFNIINVIYND